jgi:acetyl esterase/lipase
VTTRTVRYGDDPSQYGELTLPSGDPVGVAVVVHGGFWKAEYGLEYARPLVPSLVDRGWAAWAIEYRRVGPADAGGGGGVPETLDDVAAAIAKLDDLGLDLATVVGIGHSAGGHLVTWAASRGRLTHVVSQAGVLDLGAAHQLGLGGGAVKAFLGHPPGADDHDVDPVRQVPLDVPVWCVHGRADDIVPLSQSRSYVDAARSAGATAELVEVDGDHFTVVDPGSDAWRRTLEILEPLCL